MRSPIWYVWESSWKMLEMSLSRFRRGDLGKPDQPNISQGDWDLLVELHHGADREELLERPWFTYKFRIEGTDIATEPDYYFERARVLGFLDGPHHLRPVHAARDKKITALLEARDWKVIRQPYVRLTVALKKKFYAELVEAVNERIKALEGR